MTFSHKKGWRQEWAFRPACWAAPSITMSPGLCWARWARDWLELAFIINELKSQLGSVKIPNESS